MNTIGAIKAFWQFVTSAIVIALTTSCYDIGKVPVRPATYSTELGSIEAIAGSVGHLDPLTRYGGYVLTASGMPHNRYTAYLWAKNMGTLVAYETFLRKYSDGGDTAYFRSEIRKKFLPKEDEWQEAWLLYSKIEIIDGAICDDSFAPTLCHFDNLRTLILSKTSLSRAGIARISDSLPNLSIEIRE